MEKPVIVETIFKQGKDAQEAGVLRAECPYNEGSARYADWIQGWDAALKARRGTHEHLHEKADIVKVGRPDIVTDGSEDISILGDFPKES